MNRPDKAGEPSMEEILASIRQIIADDPSADRVVPVVETNSPALQTPGMAKADGLKPAGSPPLVDHLNGVFKNGSLPPTSPLGAKRPLSFDQDLADMFDEQEPSGRAPAPKPDIRVSPELTANGSRTPAAADAPKPLDAASVLPPQFASLPSSLVPPPPFGGSESKSETPAAPRTFGFPPLRKQGFYPPQNAAPVLPPIAGDAPRNGVAAAPAAAGASSSSSPDTVDVLTAISGLGSVVPGETAAMRAASTGQFGAPLSAMSSTSSTSSVLEPRTPDFSFKSSSDAREAAVDTSAPVTQAFTPSLSTPAAFKEPVADLPASDVPTSPYAFEAKPAPVTPAPAAPVMDAAFDTPPFSGHFGASAPITPHAPAGRSEPRFAAEPAPAAQSTVAAQALDALAQGLAASAAASAVSAAIAQPAVPLTPVIDPPEPTARSVPASSNLPAPAPSQPSRTLEDAVADMLRPMLQQWVADNMPRIIERALRVEVGKTTKPGGSNSHGS